MRQSLLPFIAWLVLFQSGCALTTPQPLPNPLHVRANDQEDVWERTVDVVHDYFFIERESTLGGVIETEYKIGSGVLEPWQRDSIGSYNRWESTLQSIRRKGFVRITPVEDGFLIQVDIFKELEDVRDPNNSGPGGATFQHFVPLGRDAELIGDRPSPRGWIPQGHDHMLEQEILRSLHEEVGQR